MKDTFTYALTVEDYEEFERVKAAKIGSGKLMYIIALLWLAMGVYDAVTSKDLIMLFISCVFIAYNAVIYFYNKNVRPKKLAKKYVECDPSYLSEKKITVTDKDIEVSLLPRENEPMVIGVYPYSIMNSVMEAEGFFQFVMTTEAIILPKRAIPDALRDNVLKTFRSTPNYYKMK